MTGLIQAGAGDLYKVGGDFLNYSTQNGLWDTGHAALKFTGLPGTSHHLLLTSTDLGGGFESFKNNFGWDELLIDSSNALILESGSPTGTAFYVDALIGALFSGDDITNIVGNGFNLYYNADAPENAYLRGATYQLVGGGELIAFVPEPGTLVLLLAGLGVLIILRRRRHSAVSL
jgi:hypothetical protein